MSSHQTSSNKSRSSKCLHFCFAFEVLIHITTVHLAEMLAKGDNPCVTNKKPCNICSAFSEEQLVKINHRRRYVRKQKVSGTYNTSKNELDFLGDDDMEVVFWITSRP